MKNRRPIGSALAGTLPYLAAAMLIVGASSCSNKATEEQMKTLHQLDQDRDNLQQDLSRAQSMLRDTKSKLANSQKDMADCQSQTQAASAALLNWPNVWADSADWRVVPPPAPMPTMKKSTRK